MLIVCGITQKAVVTTMSLLLRKSFSQTTSHLKPLENGLGIFLLCWISTPLNWIYRVELLHMNQLRSHDRYMWSRVIYICISDMATFSGLTVYKYIYSRMKIVGFLTMMPHVRKIQRILHACTRKEKCGWKSVYRELLTRPLIKK